MLLYFASGIAQVVLSIMVFVKSSGDYGDFVRFVKGVLVFETINIAYQQGVQQYIKSFEIGTSLIIGVILLVLGYFLWYRLNIKYFEKRILKETPGGVGNAFHSVSRPNQNFNPNGNSKVYDSYNVYGNDIKLQMEDKKKTIDGAPVFSSNVHYCRKCGNKLLEDSLFCSRCGTKVIFATEENFMGEAEKKNRNDFLAPPSAEWVCSCGYRNNASNLKCSNCYRGRDSQK